MKWCSSLYVISSVFVGAAVTLGHVTPAMAEAVLTPDVSAVMNQRLPASVEAALSYPTSAQRFFEEGNAQFEQEIQRFSRKDEPPEPLLTVQPDVQEQLLED